MLDLATMEESRGPLVLSTDRSRIDLEVVHRYLSTQSYWAAGIPRSTVARAIAGSLCFGVYRGPEQLAFGRVITDGSTLAHLCDVFVLPAHRGLGLGKWIVDAAVRHPDLRGLRNFSLATRDAHELYARFGFTPLQRPTHAMERRRPDPYGAPS